MKDVKTALQPTEIGPFGRHLAAKQSKRVCQPACVAKSKTKDAGRDSKYTLLPRALHLGTSPVCFFVAQVLECTSRRCPSHTQRTGEAAEDDRIAARAGYSDRSGAWCACVQST